MALTRPKIWDIDTNIEWFTDPLTVLHQGSTLANVDVGFIFNRANGLVSNVALYWSETAQSFVTAYTNSDGTTNTNVAVTSYAGLTTGNLTSANTVISVSNSGINYATGSHLTLANPTGSQTTISWQFAGTTTAGIRVDNAGNFLLDSYSGNYYFTDDLGPGNPISLKGAGGSTFLTVPNGTANVNLPGNVSVTSTTNSTSTATGALIVSGGAGISGNMFVGGINSNGSAYFSGNVGIGTAPSTYTLDILDLNPNLGTGLRVLGGNVGFPIATFQRYGTQAAIVMEHGSANPGMFYQKVSGSYFGTGFDGTYYKLSGSAQIGTNDLFLISQSNGNVVITSTTNSTSTTTGALTVSGGAGISGNVFAGNIYTSGLFWAGNGQVIQTGGGGGGTSITGVTSFSANSSVVAYYPTAANSATSGGFQVVGGLGVLGNIVSAGNIVGGGVRSTTSASAPSNPTVGDIWYLQGTDVTYRYTYDGTSYYWIDITGPTAISANGTTFSANAITTNNLTVNGTYSINGPYNIKGNLDITGNVNLGYGTAVTNIVRTNSGGGYTAFPSVVISPPTTVGGVQASASLLYMLNTNATIVNGGSGYTVNDVLSMVGGSLYAGSPGTFTVTSVSGGVITGLSASVNYGQYSSLPSNPVTLSGGTGSGATATVVYAIQGTSFNVTNGGSGYLEQPTVSIVGGGGSGASAYAIDGAGNGIVKTPASGISFYTPSGENLRIMDQSISNAYNVGSAANANFVTLWGSLSGAGPYIRSAGSDTNVDLNQVSQGSGSIKFWTNWANNGQGFVAAQQFQVAHTASAVNYVQVTGAATNTRPTISAQGSDGALGLNFQWKSTANAFFQSHSGANTQLKITGASAAVNNHIIGGGAAGISPTVSVEGSDTNISQVFQPKGTGAIDLAAGSSGVNISNGGTVTAITRTVTGSLYTGFPSLVITAPTTSGGVQATATPQLVAANTTVIGGGTGYTVNDVLTVTTGGGSGTINITVTSVSGGVITAATASSAALTSIPSGTVSVSGGTGTGATFTLIYVLAATFTITNAGSGYVEQPIVTFSGGGGSGAAAYATVGSAVTVKGLGSQINFVTPQGSNALQIIDSGVASPAYMQFGGATGNAINYVFGGTTANAGLYWVTKGTSAHVFTTNGSTSTAQMQVSHTSSAVNYVQVTGAATGGNPAISVQGSDSSANLNLIAKGATGFISFLSSTSYYGFRVSVPSGTATANYLQAVGSAASSAPVLSAQGTDTNIDLTLTPKGTGNVNITGNTVHTGSVVFSDTTQFNTAISLGSRNKIINGAFDVWQRGTSFTDWASFAYLVDRMRIGYDGSPASGRTLSQQTFALGQTDVLEGDPRYYIQYVFPNCGTPNNYLRWDLEGVRTLAGKKATFSFWARVPSGTMTIGVAIAQEFGTGGSPSAGVYPSQTNYTVTTTWQKFVYTTTMASVSGKTLGTNNDDRIWPAVYMPPAAAGTIQFANFQLEEGTVATPFEKRQYATELAMCQRYYWQLSAANAPYSVEGIGDTACMFPIWFPVTMRAAPSVGWSNSTSSTYYFNTVGGARQSTIHTTLSFSQSATNGARLGFGGVGGTGTMNWIDFGGGNAVATFNAEL